MAKRGMPQEQYFGLIFIEFKPICMPVIFSEQLSYFPRSTIFILP